MKKDIGQLIKEQKDKIENFVLPTLTENRREYKKELIELERLQGILIAQLKIKKTEFWDEVELDMSIKH